MSTQARATAPGVRAAARAPARWRTERGAVTAETVMVLPVLVAVALGLAWLLALATTQVRVVDAAREVARAAARDEGRGDAVALGRRVAPQGARISVRTGADTVVVRVRTAVRGPRGALGLLPVVHVEGEAVAAREGR